MLLTNPPCTHAFVSAEYEGPKEHAHFRVTTNVKRESGVTMGAIWEALHLEDTIRIGKGMGNYKISLGSQGQVKVARCSTTEFPTRVVVTSTQELLTAFEREGAVLLCKDTVKLLLRGVALPTEAEVKEMEEQLRVESLHTTSPVS